MKKVTLVTTITLSLALLATANVKADETTTTSEPTTTVTSTPETTSVETTSVEPTSETPVTTAETTVEQPSTSTSTAETLVTKTDTNITVTNPKVTIDQSDGAGRYNTFKFQMKFQLTKVIKSFLLYLKKSNFKHHSILMLKTQLMMLWVQLTLIQNQVN